jgi:hypothetical protein
MGSAVEFHESKVPIQWFLPGVIAFDTLMLEMAVAGALIR